MSWEEIEAQRKLASGYYDEAKKALEQREEWKRRAKIMLDWMKTDPQGSAVSRWFLQDYPEAKSWFEEE